MELDILVSRIAMGASNKYIPTLLQFICIFYNTYSILSLTSVVDFFRNLFSLGARYIYLHGVMIFRSSKLHLVYIIIL